MPAARFYLHHYPKQEDLADLMLEKIQSECRGDPFYKPHVLVRNQGMATWLKRQLAQKSGLAMQIEFPHPQSLLKEILDAQVIDPESLKWQIFQQLPSLLGKPDFQHLRDYLESSGNTPESELKRYQLAGIISGIFDKYLLYRPDWISSWQENSPANNVSSPLHESWQRELWRSLQSSADAHWSQTLIKGKAIELSNNSMQTLHVFGISNFAPIYVRFLYQLSQEIPVHIYWLNPVEANEGYWEDSPTRAEWLLAKEFDDPEILDSFNPLLSSLGRLGREFVHTIYGGNTNNYDVQGEDHAWSSPVIAHPQTALQSLQASIYNNTPAPADTGTNSEDNSISIHSCYSPLRELESLRDYLLTLAEKQPLDAGDVLVMCPDISVYSSAIESVFGIPSDEPNTKISYSIGDSHAPATLPDIAALIGLFSLKNSRFSNSDALELLSTPSIRDYFDLEEEDIASLKGWIVQNGIRWGFDSRHVKQAAPDCPESPWTWREGIERMLLGYAMPNEDTPQSDPVIWKNILPFHHIEGTNAQILGSVCQFLNWCEQIRKDLRYSRTLREWVSVTQQWINTGFDKSADTQQRLQALYRTLDSILETGEILTEKISSEVFAYHLRDQLENTHEPRGFLSGCVTFCEMKPMRAIPSRVLCLLGMNHDTFPRGSSEIPFDLTQHRRMAGDRSTRDDDTYAFLEALLSAREALFISYIGTSIKDGQPRPPSTSLQTLIDYMPGLAERIHHEKLHAFDPHYFQKEAPIGHDKDLLVAARELIKSDSEKAGSHKPSFKMSEPDYQNPVDPRSFITVLTNPARHFLVNCLRARTTYKELVMETDEPIGIDPLTGYRIKRRLLDTRRLTEEQIQAWIQKSDIPVGQLGEKALSKTIGNLVEETEKLPEVTATEITVSSGELTITGNVPIAEINGISTIVVTSPSKPNAKTILDGWIYQLLASVHFGTPVPSFIYNIDNKRSLKKTTISPADHPEVYLSELVELYIKAHQIPLAHFPKSAKAYIETERGEDEPEAEYEKRRRSKALKQWHSSRYSTGESEDSATTYLFDANNLFTDDFMSIAELIWHPILKHLSQSKQASLQP